MKKIAAIILILLTALQASACGSNAAGLSGQNDEMVLQEVKGFLEEEISGEITVSAYETILSQTFLEEAAKAFEAQYPGTKVNVETFSGMPEMKTMEKDGMAIMVMSDEGTQSYADYISQINTELMGGRGPDVLAIDVLPYYKYAESGLLENLQPLMESDEGFLWDSYQRNIIDALRYKDGVYMMPLNYDFDFLAYDSSLAGDAFSGSSGGQYTYSQLIEAGLPFFNSGGMKALLNQNFNSVINTLINENYNKLIDIENKKVYLDDGLFAAMLTQAQEYENLGYLEETVDFAQSLEDFSFESIEAIQEEFYLYKVKNQYSLLQHFSGEAGRMVTIGSGSGNEENDKIAGLLMDADGNSQFTSSQAYALNANSGNKRTAWEFIKFLAGEEMQSSPQMSMLGLPVHKQARDGKIKALLDGSYFGNEVLTEWDDKLETQYSDYTALLDTLSGKLQVYLVKDPVIEEMIQNELDFFIEGSKTAEEIAAILQSKIELYLNE